MKQEVEIARDIAEQKEAERVLDPGEKRFRSLIETAASVILCLSPEHRILEFNPEAERLHGRKREEVLGKDYLELFVPESERGAVSAHIKKVRPGESTRRFENRVRAGDGSERLLLWNVSRLLASEKLPCEMVG